jgi:hypothetical protein
MDFVLLPCCTQAYLPPPRLLSKCPPSQAPTYLTPRGPQVSTYSSWFSAFSTARTSCCCRCSTQVAPTSPRFLFRCLHTQASSAHPRCQGSGAAADAPRLRCGRRMHGIGVGRVRIWAGAMVRANKNESHGDGGEYLAHHFPLFHFLSRNSPFPLSCQEYTGGRSCAVRARSKHDASRPPPAGGRFFSCTGTVKSRRSSSTRSSTRAAWAT